MADITACNNEDCIQKARCYRYTCNKNPYRQSYFAEDVRNTDGSCDDFVNNGVTE